MRTIDATPLWVGIMPLLIETAANGVSPEARTIAREELLRLAQAVDDMNARNEARRADAAEPATVSKKVCTMNCGPSRGDTRTTEQCQAECTDCMVIDVAVPDPAPAPVLLGDELLYTLRAMAAFGGGFANHVAAALSVADSSNCERIQRALPEMMAKYGPGTDFYAAMRSASGH